MSARLAIGPGHADYWLGLKSSITTQGEVTVNVQIESGEIKVRRANMNRDISRAKSYQGGENVEHLHVLPGELVMGWVSRQGRNLVPGNPNQIGFTSLNGVKWGAYGSDEELKARIKFIGLAKTPFFIEDAKQLQV